jgi:hypothetical protein
MPVFFLRAVLAVLLLISMRYARSQGDDDDAALESSGDVQIEVLVFAFPGKGMGAEAKPGQGVAGGTQNILSSGSGHYVEIPSNSRRLAGAYSKLLANADTKPLAFTAWQQGLSDQRYIDLRGEKVHGRLLMKPGKPLSLRIELQLDGEGSVSYRLRASRPAHFGETLYFDHPAFGALVRIDQIGAGAQ